MQTLHLTVESMRLGYPAVSQSEKGDLVSSHDNAFSNTQARLRLVLQVHSCFFSNNPRQVEEKPCKSSHHLQFSVWQEKIYIDTLSQ